MSTTRRCLICARPAPFGQLYEFAGYRLVRCPSCRLVFQEPQPSQSVLDGSYYHDEDFAQALLGPLRAWTLDRAHDKLRLLRATVPDAQVGRVLDVGCSSGAWLEVAASQGWQATGVEIGEAVARGARERGLDVRTGTLADALPGLSPSSYDLITFWDVLEHLRDPGRELDLARQLLRPGGLIAATFPNVAGWYPRLTYGIFARWTGVWEYPELPVHLYDFSPATARRLFQNHGMSPVGTRTFSLPFDFYLSTTLARERLGRSRRARRLRLAFDALHRVVYPLARLADRENQVMIAGRLADDR